MAGTYICDLHGTETPRGSYCEQCNTEAWNAIARAETMPNEERIATFERFITTERLSIDIGTMGALLSTLLGRQIEIWEAGARNYRNLIAEIKAQPSRPNTTKVFRDFLNVMPPNNRN